MDFSWRWQNHSCVYIPRSQRFSQSLLNVDRSIVVERLLTECSMTDIGVAFCYCEYKKQAEQTVTALLASLLRQLIERRGHDLPDEVLDVYKTHAANGTRLQIDESYDLLRAELNRWPQVFIVVDALDEYHRTSEARMELLVMIEKLPPNLHLLCTSRFLADIEGQLGIRYPRVEIRAQDSDIDKYVSSRIEEVGRLKRFIQSFPDLKKSIIEAVTSKADGMYDSNL